MNDETNVFYALKIKFDKESRDLIKEFTNSLKKTNILFKKDGTDELTLECITNNDFSILGKVLSIYICNGFVLSKLLDVGRKEKMNQQKLDLFIEQFFKLFKNEMAYFHMLTEIDIKRYLKTNNVLDISKYWSYNLASMNKDLQKILHDENKRKLLYTNIQDIFDNNYDLLISTAEIIRTKILEAKKDFKNPEQIEVLLDEDNNVKIFDSKTNYNIDMNIFPTGLEKSIDIKNFSMGSYILLMILITEPQKAIIYDGFDEDTLDILYNFISDCEDILLEKNIEIYFSDEDPLAS